MRILFLTAATLAVLTHSILAQTPRGTHTYHIYGTGMGAEMPAWNGAITVRDTMINGKRGELVHFGSRLDGNEWRFNSWAWFNHEQTNIGARSTARSRGGDGACEVRVVDRMIALSDGGKAISVGPFERAPVPDFALAHMIAAMQLSDGAAFKLRAFRCENSDAPRPIQSWDFDGNIASATHARSANAAPEPVWSIRGSASYPYEVVIAKRDRMVLRFEIPQGGAGTMVLEYRGTQAGH